MNEDTSTKHESPAQPAKAAWSKPVLKTLHVSLDTAFGAGSAGDGDGVSVPE